jgi:hypothetical protein
VIGGTLSGHNQDTRRIGGIIEVASFFLRFLCLFAATPINIGGREKLDFRNPAESG